ncbi:MAG TPA: hypothetical protein VF699_14320 [Caulobacteraceae bacterium]|jgi:hypothetical protein
MKGVAYVAAITGAVAMAAGAAQAQVAQGLELGLQTYAYRYDESFHSDDFGSGSISDDGQFYGFSVEYGRPVGGWSFEARFRYGQGEVDYRSSEGDRIDDVSQFSGQLELLAGRPFANAEGRTITPYAGLGSRVLFDESGGRVTNTGLEGYDREISYAYVPLGLAVRQTMTGGLDAVVYAQFNWVVGGASESDFGPEGGPLVELEFEGGHGWEAGVTVSRPLGRGRIGFGPFLRTWRINESAPFLVEEDGVLFEIVEPENETTELGLKLTYAF